MYCICLYIRNKKKIDLAVFPYTAEQLNKK